MDILFAKNGATVMEVCATMDDPPTDMAVRRLMHILEEKGHVTRRKKGREYIYRPKVSKKDAGMKMLQHVLNIFFEGGMDNALAAHLGKKCTNVTQDQLEHMLKLIEKVRKDGR
jgi:predicted transcriptional regulator